MANTLPRLNLWYEPAPFQNSQAREQKNHNWAELQNFGKYIGNYVKGITDSWEIRFAAQLNQIPQPNEVIDARVDSENHTFPDLHAHLINIEKTRVQFEESDYEGAGSSGLAINLKVRDLGENSIGLSYVSQGTVQEDTPRMGYMECKVNDLTVNQA